MDVQVTVGHVINMAIDFLDQNGNPMLTPVAPDSPPVWSNTTPATETLAVSGDGLKAVATPLVPGTDTVNTAVIVGGVSFAANLGVNVSPAPQVLTSVVITPTVV